jgi:hypothetical protein
VYATSDYPVSPQLAAMFRRDVVRFFARLLRR